MVFVGPSGMTLTASELDDERNQYSATVGAQSSVYMLNSCAVFGCRQVAALRQGNFDEHLHQTTHIQHDRRLSNKHLKHIVEHAPGAFLIKLC